MRAEAKLAEVVSLCEMTDWYEWVKSPLFGTRLELAHVPPVVDVSGRITRLHAYPEHVEISGPSLMVTVIPGAVCEYRVNGRTGSRNDCNACDGAVYIADLVSKLVTVSILPVEILGDMPELGL